MPDKKEVKKEYGRRLEEKAASRTAAMREYRELLKLVEKEKGGELHGRINPEAVQTVKGYAEKASTSYHKLRLSYLKALKRAGTKTSKKLGIIGLLGAIEELVK